MGPRVRSPWALETKVKIEHVFAITCIPFGVVAPICPNFYVQSTYEGMLFHGNLRTWLPFPDSRHNMLSQNKRYLFR